MKILQTGKDRILICAISHLLKLTNILKAKTNSGLQIKESSNECIEKTVITFNCH